MLIVIDSYIIIFQSEDDSGEDEITNILFKKTHR